MLSFSINIEFNYLYLACMVGWESLCNFSVLIVKDLFNPLDKFEVKEKLKKI